MRAGILLNRLVARIVKVVAVGGIRSLTRRHGGIEFDAERFQPLDHRDALIAEAAQRRIADRVADLVPQVLVHRIGRVVVAGGLLIARAAARVYDAAAFGARAAAAESIGDDHRRAGARRLDRGTRTRRAEPGDQHVTLVVPGDLGAALDAQRRFDRQ